MEKKSIKLKKKLKVQLEDKQETKKKLDPKIKEAEYISFIVN
jgi:hypothetical protein